MDSFRCGPDVVQVDRPTVTINPNSQPGTKLYKRFHKALRRADDKTVKVMFHGGAVQA